MSAHEMVESALAHPCAAPVFTIGRDALVEMASEWRRVLDENAAMAQQIRSLEDRCVRQIFAADRLHEALIELVRHAGPVIEDAADTATWNEAVSALTKAREVLAGQS